MTSLSSQLKAWIAGNPVIPVIVIDDVTGSVPLVNALHEGGLNVFEVTLRTKAALPSIAAIARAFPNAIVGAGTVLNPDDAAHAFDAGAKFIVSPGYSPALGRACADMGLPLLPGAATSSEVMAVLNDGYDLMKFFPAEAAGGIPMLRALSGPFPKVSFCPTGGIDAAKAAAYLSLPNVSCVGGSWLTPRELVRQRDWDQIRALAATAAGMAPNSGGS